MLKIYLGCIFALLVSATALAGPKLDSLLVYGKDFIFSVEEPIGWVADTKRADEYQCNILIYPGSHDWKNSDGMIRIRVDDKTDEHVDKDLAADMNDYRSHYPNVQFADIIASHPEYRVYPKVFYIPNNFYEYVAYVNPGPQSALMFSVAMNKQKIKASQNELTAFREAIASLRMLKSPKPSAPANGP